MKWIFLAVTDGAPAMMGNKSGFVAHLKEDVLTLMSYQWVIHSSVLCSQLSGNFVLVTKTIMQLVNFLQSTQALYHRLFKTFLKEANADQQDLLHLNDVRWLSKRELYNTSMVDFTYLLWTDSEWNSRSFLEHERTDFGIGIWNSRKTRESAAFGEISQWQKEHGDDFFSSGHVWSPLAIKLVSPRQRQVLAWHGIRNCHIPTRSSAVWKWHTCCDWKGSLSTSACFHSRSRRRRRHSRPL